MIKPHIPKGASRHYGLIALSVTLLLVASGGAIVWKILLRAINENALPPPTTAAAQLSFADNAPMRLRVENLSLRILGHDDHSGTNIAIAHLKSGLSFSKSSETPWLPAGLDIEATQTSIKNKKMSVLIDGFSGNARHNAEAGTWRGDWRVTGVRPALDIESLQPFDGDGTAVLTNAHAIIAGIIQNQTGTHLDFSYTHDFANPEKKALSIVRARHPWNGGTVGIENVRISLSGEQKPIAMNIRLQNIALDQLLQQLTGDKTTGTGALSGSLPITLAPDGRITMGKGKLSAHGPGILHLSPQAIPGDTPQIAFVRDVLKDLSYTSLSIDVESDAENRLFAALKVEGKAPNISQQRPVHLNVRLQGNMLDFIQQNILSMTDPRKFLEMRSDEKP